MCSRPTSLCASWRSLGCRCPQPPECRKSGPRMSACSLTSARDVSLIRAQMSHALETQEKYYRANKVTADAAQSFALIEGMLVGGSRQATTPSKMSPQPSTSSPRKGARWHLCSHIYIVCENTGAIKLVKQIHKPEPNLFQALSNDVTKCPSELTTYSSQSMLLSCGCSLGSPIMIAIKALHCTPCNSVHHQWNLLPDGDRGTPCVNAIPGLSEYIYM